jgi:hypothetical protein
MDDDASAAWPASARCPRLLGGACGWGGPMACVLIAEGALAHRSATPWVWPARPHDRGGAICACLVFAAGLALVTVRGARESVRETST